MLNLQFSFFKPHSIAQAGSAQAELDQNHITTLNQPPPGNRPETFSLQTTTTLIFKELM